MVKEKYYLIPIIIACASMVACSNQPEYDLETERSKYKTKLVMEMKAPQDYEEEDPPEGVSVVYYESGALKRNITNRVFSK